ncbi:3-keto-disaccharide hydrolase [Gynurincola endophyticus]|jgi:hypothetical protein|uniref:3-keto-disaccharide hydrolase n=1 Tax=Gynurincola endophyticus TaxID=2479004 RepID=UPI000F8DE01A|nr:DUF1080 domain-containing protein [Gynurincola endophyticus]
MKYVFLAVCTLTASSLFAQERNGDPKLTESWKPVPPVVNTQAAVPGDAIILFDGKNMNGWKHKDGSAVKWDVKDGILTVKGGTGEIISQQSFGDCQLHIEWRTPATVKGEGQGRGNSGIFLMSTYELQVLDSYNNTTYSNGQAGSIYKQTPPLVNASKGPGEWQTYDIIFTAPRFNDQGMLKSPATITVLHNGVLVQNNTTIWGSTQYIGLPDNIKHADKLPLILQDHGDPVSFRNIWIRNL